MNVLVRRFLILGMALAYAGCAGEYEQAARQTACQETSPAEADGEVDALAAFAVADQMSLPRNDIARALAEAYPEVDLEQVSLLAIYHWTMALPDFDDEPELANDAILTAIFQEWFEEVTLI